MGGVTDRFAEMTRELAAEIARHTRPISFITGAGASLSSGAPTTYAVHEQLRAATNMRLENMTRERLHEIVDETLREAVAPLFTDVSPNSGYRLLAALGRQRRVNVINLNWDDAIEQACTLGGVPCEPLDPVEGQTLAEAQAGLPPDRGVLVVHVHGILRRRPRYSLLETLPSPEIWAQIRPLFAHTTIICGASLTGDIDVAEAIHRAAGAPEDAPEVWHFARPAPVESPELPANWWRVIAPDVDFDALTAIIAEAAWHAHGHPDARWQDLVANPNLAHLRLPDVTNLLELSAAVRRATLRGNVAALIARPNVGKTTGTLRLAHLRALIEAPRSRLLTAFDLHDSASALSVAAETPGLVALIDDPFGPGRPEGNPRAGDFLEAIAEGAGSWAYVSSRESNWNRHAGRLQRPMRGLVVPSRDPRRWYHRRDLLRLAELKAGANKDIARRATQLVERGRASTPPEVEECVRLGRVNTDEARADEARALLDEHRSLALTSVLVRMQELRLRPLPEAELQAIVDADPRTLPGVHVLLNRYIFEQRPQWEFAHPTGRQVTDNYLLDHHGRVEAELLGAAVVPSWIKRTLDTWRLQYAISPASGAGFEVDPPPPGDWLTERLATAPTDGLLREIAETELDEWETIELAYVLVLEWDSISDLPGAEVLLQSLLTRPGGSYALLEGCLYYGLGADDELWSRVAARLWALSKNHESERERMLALDAVLWKTPDESVARWAAHTIERLDPETPAFAFLRFAAGYHPDGLERLGAPRARDLDRNHAFTLEQAQHAAHFVAWHYAHQSRARAMRPRYDHYDAHWLSLRAGEGPTNHAVDAALALASSLARFPETCGWAFHLLCNLAVVADLDLAAQRVQDLVEQALESAPAGDPGVISAVLAYEPADMFRRELQARIIRLGERNAYLDALAVGVTYGDLHVGPPRFSYIHDPARVLRTIGADFQGLEPEMADLAPSEIAERLWVAAPEAMSGAELHKRREVARRIGCAERGDLRPLEVVAARGTADPDPYVWVITRWREEIPSEQGDKLF